MYKPVSVLVKMDKIFILNIILITMTLVTRDKYQHVCSADV